jgi:hypothetical protein
MTPDDRWLDLSEGDEFARYRIERRLARGGMGVLYLAIEPGLERRVALKLIAPEAAADEVFRRRFAEESRIAASIEHPNVVPIYAAGEESGVAYIAMRYVSGSDLARRLVRTGRLPPPTAIAMAVQVGNGLDAIHAAGLVHRDVKPANVLLSGEEGAGHAYITDFGVARNVATRSGLTQTGRFVGTLDYVAPEQISGEPVDARADVYALGCLLYKLLTGEVPFPKEGEAARLYAHLNEPPPAPSLYVPEVSMALDDVVLRALSKAPEDRYPSAGDLGRAAEAALRGERPELPERTVATGEAATRTAAAIPTAVPAPTAGDEPTPRLEPTTARASRLSAFRLPKAAIAATALAGLAVALVLVLGGGDDDGGRSREAAENRRDGGSAAARANGEGADTPAKPRTLSAPRLVARADAICADSKSSYVAILDPERELSADVPYARELVGISTPAVERFRALRPPRGLEGEYRRYVEAQERVRQTDVDALRAARDGDAAEVAAARERRDAEQEERERLARQIGFRVCSVPGG